MFLFFFADMYLISNIHSDIIFVEISDTNGFIITCLFMSVWLNARNERSWNNLAANVAKKNIKLIMFRKDAYQKSDNRLITIQVTTSFYTRFWSKSLITEGNLRCIIPIIFHLYLVFDFRKVTLLCNFYELIFYCRDCKPLTSTWEIKRDVDNRALVSVERFQIVHKASLFKT